MASVTDTKSQPYLYAIVSGLGPDTETAGDSQAFRFTTRDVGLTPAGRWLPILTVLPNQLDTELNVLTGETKVGGFTLEMLEGKGQVGVSPNKPVLTDLFATRDKAKVGALAANVTAAALTIDVDRLAGGVPVVNEVLAIGAERMRITIVGAGTGLGGSDRLTVTRAYYETTAQAHFRGESGGDPEVRYVAHYLRTRPVALWLNFVGNVESQAQRVGNFVLDQLRLKADGVTWQLRLRGTESLMDREIGERVFTGRGRNPFWLFSSSGGELGLDSNNWEAPDDYFAFFRPETSILAGQTIEEEPINLSVDAAGGGYARYGQSCVEYDTPRQGVGAYHGATLTAWKVGRTPLPEDSDETLAVREVMPTDASLAHSYFKPRAADPADAGVQTASDHPLDIFLCLATSTGDGPWPAAGSNFNTTETNWDVLPEKWGAGIPIGRFNTSAFNDLKRRLSFAKMPNLIVGWDGPINLKEFSEKHLLGPLGIAILPDSNGLLRPVRIQEKFVGDASIVVDAEDIIPQSSTFVWDFGLQVTAQKWEFDHQGPDGDPGHIISVVSPRSRFRFGTTIGDKKLEIEARGLTRENGFTAIVERSMFIDQHFVDPAPTITLRLNWNQLFLSVGDVIKLTHPTLPNIITGTRGLTAQIFIVTRKRFVFDGIDSRGGGGGVEVRLFWVGLDGLRMVYWAPSAIVNDVANVATVTVLRNEFSDGFAGNSVPADDTGGFSVGGVGVGDTVILINADGVLRSDNTPRITGVTATTVVLSDTFRSAGVAIVRAVGDVIVYSGESGAASYTVSAWTTAMRDHGAWADNASKNVGNTSLINAWGD